MPSCADPGIHPALSGRASGAQGASWASGRRSAGVSLQTRSTAGLAGRALPRATIYAALYAMAGKRGCAIEEVSAAAAPSFDGVYIVLSSFWLLHQRSSESHLLGVIYVVLQYGRSALLF